MSPWLVFLGIEENLVTTNLPVQLVANVSAEQSEKVVAQALMVRSLDRFSTDNGVYSTKEIADVVIGPLQTEITTKLDHLRQQVTDLTANNDQLEAQIDRLAEELFTLEYLRKTHGGLYRAVAALAKQISIVANNKAAVATEYITHTYIKGLKTCLIDADSTDIILAQITFEIDEKAATGRATNISTTNIDVCLTDEDLREVVKNAASLKLSPEQTKVAIKLLSAHSQHYDTRRDIATLKAQISAAEKDLRKLAASAKSVVDNMALRNLQNDAQASEQAKHLAQQIRDTMTSLTTNPSHHDKLDNKSVTP